MVNSILPSDVGLPHLTYPLKQIEIDTYEVDEVIITYIWGLKFLPKIK